MSGKLGYVRSVRTISVALGFGVSAAIVFIVACLFGSFSDTALDIPMHDTYYVVATWQGYLAVALLLGGFALIHVLLERGFKLKLARPLTLTHFAFSLPLVIFFCIEAIRPIHLIQTPRRYYSYDQFDQFDPPLFHGIGVFAAIVLILFALGQLALLVAIVGAVFRIRR